MDPQIPVAPPGAEVLTPAMYGAIGYVLLAFGHWVAKNGLPWVTQALGLVSERDKEVAARAKEGPIMVLERVERQLADSEERAAKDKAEHSKQLAEVLIELKDLRKQHGDCERNHAELQAEVKYLRQQVAELKGEE
jgi:hypothetical protein